MRVSTNTIYESANKRLGDLQSGQAKMQEQMSSGRRILSPSDDPVAAAQALEFTQAQSANAQYGVNRQNARNSLTQEEGVLGNVTDLLQDLKTLTVSAGNGTLSDTERQYLATELRGRLDDLVSLANTRDGAGNYLFSGFQTGAQPFTKTATGAQYAGDQGQRLLQAGAVRQLTVNDSGSAVFEQIPGYKTVGSAAVVTNTGTGTISPAAILDSTLLKGHSYDIDFSAGGTAFSVYDITTDPGKTTPLTGSGSYTSGNAISFDGLQFTISGAPANGDSFTIRPDTRQSVFSTLTNLINVLETPTSSTTAKTNLDYGLAVANGNIDNALDHVLGVRASVGSRLKELDSLDNTGEDLNLQYAQSLSQLQDLDYTKAITDFTKQNVILQAAQQSFVKTAQLSLFSLFS